jgi:Protein of unknown function (DUF3467)
VSDESEEPQSLQVTLPAEVRAGVWANFATVAHSPYEFTLNFIQIDYATPGPTGIVIARVHMSPLFVSQLIEALHTNWQSYAEKAMPQEVYGGDNDDQRDGQGHG